MATFTNIGTKFQVGAAACAIAGAAVLTPGAVANASPAMPIPTAGLGSSLDALCDETDSGGDCLSPFASASAGGSANAAPTFLCNAAWCFGNIPEPAPENIAVFEFNAIPLFPEAIQPLLYGFWEGINPNGINVCILGATYRLDSYSTMTVGLTRGCTG